MDQKISVSYIFPLFFKNINFIAIAIAGNKVDLLGENNSAVDVGKNFAKV